MLSTAEFIFGMMLYFDSFCYEIHVFVLNQLIRTTLF